MDGVGGGGEGSQTTGLAPLLLWLQRNGVLAVNGWLFCSLWGVIRFCGVVVGVEATLVARRDWLVAGAHLRVRVRVRVRVREQACSAYCFCDRHGHREHDRVEIFMSKEPQKKNTVPQWGVLMHKSRSARLFFTKSFRGVLIVLVILVVFVETGVGGGVLDPHTQRQEARARRGPQAGMAQQGTTVQSLGTHREHSVDVLLHTWCNACTALWCGWCGVP